LEGGREVRSSGGRKIPAKNFAPHRRFAPKRRYAALSREQEVSARADAALIKGLIRRTAEDVIEVGKALIRQRSALKGVFLDWVQAEFEMSQRTAIDSFMLPRCTAAHLPVWQV
jgi:hypothetical protein